MRSDLISAGRRGRIDVGVLPFGCCRPLALTGRSGPYGAVTAHVPSDPDCTVVI